MKRPGKCANKRAYSTRGAALAVAERMYFQGNKRLALYECPTCLDFHLTTKYCNLQSKISVWKNRRIAKAEKVKRYKEYGIWNRIFKIFARLDYSLWVWKNLKLLSK